MMASEPSTQNLKIQIRSREGNVRALILAVQYSINVLDFMKGDLILHVRYQIYGSDSIDWGGMPRSNRDRRWLDRHCTTIANLRLLTGRCSQPPTQRTSPAQSKSPRQWINRAHNYADPNSLPPKSIGISFAPDCGRYSTDHHWPRPWISWWRCPAVRPIVTYV
jgi:hypothetical protein